MQTLDPNQILITGDFDLTATTGQFGPSDAPIGDRVFLGVGEPVPVGGDFQFGGGVSAKIPFVGTTELFRAEVSGSIAGRFGLEFVWEFDPGAVNIVQNYDISVAAPGQELAVTDVYGVATQAVFDPLDPDGGYLTEFPKLKADLNAILELAAQLQATYGVLGKNRTDEIFDFDVGTSLPIFSFETGRVDEDGNANDFEFFGETTDSVLNRLGADVETADGQYTIELSDLFSGTRTQEDEVEVEFCDDEDDDDDNDCDDEPDFEADVTTTQTIDLGDLVLDIPEFSVEDDGFDADRGAYVTDTDTNSENIAQLTLDVDGIATRVTGGSFPPLELVSETTIEVGPATLSADFSYNLIDVEIIGGLPLVQFFTVTPDVESRLKFVDPVTKAAKEVDLQLTRKEILFDADGTFQSDVVEARLRELAKDSAKFATDIDLFVDFDAGIPGTFTGDTASIGGAVVQRLPGGDFMRIDNQEAVARSAPILGDDQDAPVPVPLGTDFAYAIFITDPAAPGGERTELIPLEFDPISVDDPSDTFRLTDTIWTEVRTTATERVTETPWYGAEGDFDIIYLEDTEVLVETRAGGSVRNQTGLGLTLDVLLQGLAASAEFGIEVDLGLFEFGGSIGFGFDELFSRTFNIFDFTDEDEILTLFDETFEVDTDTSPITEAARFVVGPGNDQGEDLAIRGTDGPELLGGTPGDDVIIGLDGDDTLAGGGGDDTLLPGLGADIIRGGDGLDRLSYEDFVGQVFQDRGDVQTFGSSPIFNGFLLTGLNGLVGLDITGSRSTVLGDGAVDIFSDVEILQGESKGVCVFIHLSTHNNNEHQFRGEQLFYSITPLHTT